jgi:hypothetical protein
MNEDFQKATQEAVAFQKIWSESLTRMMQAAFTMNSNSAPPDVIRQIRSGIFQALAESWDEFMRSPQFLEGMRQWMENAINFRKLTNDFLARARNEMQAPSRGDIDTIMQTVHHMEKRLLDRVGELSAQISALEQRLEGQAAQAKPRPRAAGKPTRARHSRVRVTTNEDTIP